MSDSRAAWSSDPAHPGRGDGVEVLLIGGTSHLGKSTLGQRLADELGWNHLTTDRLARHPGRPWREDGTGVPAEVTSHFLSGSPAELVESVRRHYESNVWPIVDAIVRSHLDNPFDPCLVLEGSAILPRLAHAARRPGVACVWLTAREPVLVERIRESSRWDSRSAAERRSIDAFVARALAFDRFVTESAARLGERCVDVSTGDVFDELLALVRARGRA